MSGPLFEIWNTHTDACGAPPAITNKPSKRFYYGYFQNRFGEQWVFSYDLEQKVAELRGGDIGWETAVPVRDGIADVMLGKAELAWLFACWTAATGAG
jgi:hypothetical protein